MKKLMLALFVCVIGILSIPGRSFSADTLLIADFESHPNNLGGEVGVYGSLEPNWDDKATPYSWYYTKDVPGYDAINAHGGKQSFRLVNALGSKKAETWGSFSADLGQVTDAVPVPKKVQSKDASSYKYLVFWVKGEKGGEMMEMLFRDSHAPSYMPQARYKVESATKEWKKVSIPLAEISKQGVDMKSLDNIGIAFGPDAGNAPGAIIYIDDMAFSND